MTHDGGASQAAALPGVDGVVFVADSIPDRLGANVDAMDRLRSDLEQQQQDLGLIPFCIQYNKRDAPNATPIAELRRALNPLGAPEFEAVAVAGSGVFDSVKAVLGQVLTELRKS